MRRDIAVEYLDIDPVEAGQLFTTPIASVVLYGFAESSSQDGEWIQTAVVLSEFLERTGLDYCEFLDLWRSDFVPFSRVDRDREGGGGVFDDCPPCDPDRIGLRFDQDIDTTAALAELALFIRLWRKLKQHRCGGYTFAELADICTVLGMFDADGNLNPDFIAQLAAFQMLRDLLCLPLQLLALWNPSAAPEDWTRAVSDLLKRWEKLEPTVLDALSVLAGFDPTVATDTWHASPTRTLRFVEVLAKVDACSFTVGEIELLCSGTHVPGDDPFLPQSDGDAEDDPLELPDDGRGHSLWALRAHLLEAEADAEDLEHWSWPRIQNALIEEFGYAPSGSADPLRSLARARLPARPGRRGPTGDPGRTPVSQPSECGRHDSRHVERRPRRGVRLRHGHREPVDRTAAVR